MTAIARRGELTKLARVIGRPVEELGFVDGLDVHGVRTLREALSARLFDDARPVLQRVAKGARLLPTSMVARVGEKVFGPMLSAQIAGLLAPPYALDIALRMSDPFLGEVSALIDPRSAAEVIVAIPADRVVAVAALLLGRADYVTLARFVDYLTAATIGAVIDSIPDERELLRIAAYVESASKLAELVGQLAPARVRAMIAALHGADAELWLEALAVADLLDDGLRRMLGDMAAALEPEVLTALVAAAHRHGMWSAAVPFVLAMSPTSRQRFVTLPALGDPAVIAAIEAAANETGRGEEVRALLGDRGRGS